MKYTSLLISFILILVLISSCDFLTNKVCGDPLVKTTVLADSLNQKYKDILVASAVPCFPNYFQINLKKEVDQTTIDHLYITIKNKSYIQVLIYNSTNQLIKGSTVSM